MVQTPEESITMRLRTGGGLPTTTKAIFLLSILMMAQAGFLQLN